MAKKKGKKSAKGGKPASKGSEAQGKLKTLSRKTYEKELVKLQVELVRLQAWVKKTNSKIIVIFEGRDAAGKGGLIKAICERVSPRVFRVVALPTPTERQKSQVYFQRYFEHLPAGGEVILFDRSWYNRAGIERVMGYCTQHEYDEFMRICPNMEMGMVRAGVTILKYFLDVSQEEQERRFLRRIHDPLRQWKLSPMDLESYRRWWDYTEAIDTMIAATDTPVAPWYVVNSDDKRRARLSCISHLLSKIPYKRVKTKRVKLPPRQKKNRNQPKTIMFKNVVDKK